ncbi:X-Pro dipeptidyl-peptidase [Jiangella alkaliphila]|uniref:Xaa-Pro dipeptidyl-peptidase n=2 Tax=Jiangella alkaliphila TaxID=419479 RepID=A0A1H2J5R3_9ACTN|nr:X-Pro dipeptidyl-peptidase [Jiangella alkaliphila]
MLPVLVLPAVLLPATTVPATAEPDEPGSIVVEDGVTQPVFSYDDAIREVVRVQSPVISQDSGEPDLIYVDIIRPAASDGDLKVPTIIHTSPYFMGWQDFSNNRHGEIKPPPGAPLDFFPRFYDNYFVPRGYAVALVDLTGSRASTGCADVGGPAETEGLAAVVEWLAGEGHAVDLDGDEVTADWANGLSGMIGKSWDGTVPNAVAARGTEGLATIVPLVALSDWHTDFWANGARHGGTPTLWHDRHSDNPAMATECDTVRAELAAGQEDPDPGTDFWRQRTFVPDADKVEASVFVVSAMNDYTVPPVNFGRWWEALGDADVPRKLWLSQTAHEEPFDFRRTEWVSTLHRWFDHWLQGVDNGIMDEPMVEIERAPGEWTAHDDWPSGATAPVWLGTPRDAGDPRLGTLRTDPRDAVRDRTATFTETRRSVSQLAAAPTTVDPRRLVFQSPVLSEPVRISGSADVTVDARFAGPNATLTVLLVDYGEAERLQHATDGGLANLPTRTCFGAGNAADTGCYADVGLRTHIAPFEVVTRGWSYPAFQTGVDALEPGTDYRLTIDLQHHDYVYEAGHRIGVVIAGAETGLVSNRHPTTGNPIEIDLLGSRVELPVVGGPSALRAAFE